MPGPTAFIDHVETLHCEERGGVIRSITRLARVVGLVDTDYTVLLTALEGAGIPVVPSVLEGEGFEALLLDDRSATIVDRDSGTVDVTLVYRHILDSAQELDQLEALDPGTLYGKNKCSIQQVETNFYTDPDTGEHIQIVLNHTFPDGTDKYKDPITKKTLPADDLYPGKTRTQGGTIKASVVMSSFSMVMYINTDDPSSVEDAIAGHVNAEGWKRKPPRTWLCTEAEWEIIDIGRYKFGFEFQHNPYGWDESAVFIDDRTSRPPVALIEGEGKKEIKFLDETNFSEFFKAFFE